MGQKTPSYKYVDYDSNGFADASKFLPFPFDMCLLKMKDKILSGWYTGKNWDGLNVKPTDNILSWKRVLR